MKKIFTLVFATMTLSIIAQVQVTFQVDMTGLTVSSDGVHIAGSLNGWTPDSDMLTDQGNNIYAITLDLTPGADYEFKYLNGNAWGTEEAAPGSCTVGGNNRIITTPTSDVTLEVTPFNGCSASATTQMVKFSVDMTGQTISGNGVHVAGNFNGWSPGSTALSDVGNNIYEVSVPVVSSISVLQYKFLNGNDWGMEETPGSGCGNGDNNRIFIIQDAGDVDLPTATFGGCANPVPTRKVVFRVNLDGAMASTDGVHVAGSFQGWNPEGTPMNDIGNDNYEVAVDVMKPITYIEYKYINGNAWGNEESIPGECNYNNNRFALIELNSADTVYLENYIFGTCNDLTTSTEEINLLGQIQITPTIARDNVFINFQSAINEPTMLMVHNLNGSVLYERRFNDLFNSDHITIDVSNWIPGIYVVRFSNAKQEYSQKIMVK